MGVDSYHEGECVMAIESVVVADDEFLNRDLLEEIFKIV